MSLTPKLADKRRLRKGAFFKGLKTIRSQRFFVGVDQNEDPKNCEILFINGCWGLSILGSGVVPPCKSRNILTESVGLSGCFFTGPDVRDCEKMAEIGFGFISPRQGEWLPRHIYSIIRCQAPAFTPHPPMTCSTVAFQ